MNEFLTRDKLSAIEFKFNQGSKLNLINNVGQAVSKWIKQKFPIQNNILILVGKGNNGADGISTALNLLKLGFSVSVSTIMPELNPQSSQLLVQFKNKQGIVLKQIPTSFLAYDIIIDAILGHGINTEISLSLQQILNKINLSYKIIISLDTPTGINPFNGKIYTDSVKANYTLTFIGDKPGFHTGEALDRVGQVIVMPLTSYDYILDNDSNIDTSIHINRLDTINYNLLKRTTQNTNKGKFGTTVIIGGATGMQGALYLAGRSAILLGSGRVILGFLNDSFSPDYLMPELMTRNAKDIINDLDNYTTLVIGPGLGNSAQAVKILTKVIQQKSTKCKLIFDADALNILAANPKLIKQFKLLPNKAITPHPLEAARLLNLAINKIEEDRFSTINALTKQYEAITLLKGAGSLIQYIDKTFINQSGNVVLSTAGSGDILCGIIAAFSSQGMDLFDSVRLGVYLHGLSADYLVQNIAGFNGILASELAYAARHILNKLIYN